MPGLYRKRIDFDTYELPTGTPDPISSDSEAEEVDSVMLSVKGSLN